MAHYRAFRASFASLCDAGGLFSRHAETEAQQHESLMLLMAARRHALLIFAPIMTHDFKPLSTRTHFSQRYKNYHCALEMP